MENPIIYTSEWLARTPETSGVAKAIFAALDELQIEHRELKNTKDYWCRDYMPVCISKNDGWYTRYKYSPDYLIEYKTKRKYITKQEDACKSIMTHLSDYVDIVFDGGNYVRCGNKVIMTDKIFSENPQISPNALLTDLQFNLLWPIIILLPWDMKEPYGHSDGMVACLGDNKILLTGYWKQRNKKYHKRLLKILSAHFEVVELPDWKGSDTWCYINYLQVPGGILLPCLSEDFSCESDVAAIETFGKLFPDSRIMPIYAYPLIKNGGAIHCVTWEKYPNRDIVFADPACAFE